MNDSEEQRETDLAASQPDQLDAWQMEITDLEPDAPSYTIFRHLQTWVQRQPASVLLRQAFARLWRWQSRPGDRHQRRVRIGQICTAVGLTLVLLALLLGNIGPLRGRVVALLQASSAGVTPTLSLSSVPDYSRVMVRGRSTTILPGSFTNLFGKVPSVCPRADTLQQASQTFGVPVLDLGPLRILGFAGPSAALIQLTPVFNEQRTPTTILSWSGLVNLFIPQGYTGPIVLRGASQTSNAVLSFSNTDLTPNGTWVASTLLSLNPLAPEPGQQFTATDSWESIAVHILVPTAGCYYLQANWQGSTWYAWFAIGLEN